MGCAPFLGADSILLIELIGNLSQAGTLPPQLVCKTTTDWTEQPQTHVSPFRQTTWLNCIRLVWQIELKPIGCCNKVTSLGPLDMTIYIIYMIENHLAWRSIVYIAVWQNTMQYLTECSICDTASQGTLRKRQQPCGSVANLATFHAKSGDLPTPQSDFCFVKATIEWRFLVLLEAFLVFQRVTWKLLLSASRGHCPQEVKGGQSSQRRFSGPLLTEQDVNVKVEFDSHNSLTHWITLIQHQWHQVQIFTCAN